MSAAFSNRLREAREAKGLSQVDLARRTGLTRQAVYSIETNRYQPNVALALRLAEVLELRVEDIFGADPSGPVVEGERLGGKGSSPGDGGSRAALWTLRQRTLVLPLSELGPALSYTTASRRPDPAPRGGGGPAGAAACACGCWAGPRRSPTTWWWRAATPPSISSTNGCAGSGRRGGSSPGPWAAWPPFRP